MNYFFYFCCQLNCILSQYAIHFYKVSCYCINESQLVTVCYWLVYYKSVIAHCLFQDMTYFLIHMNLSRYLLSIFDFLTGTFEVQHHFYNLFSLVLDYYSAMSDLIFKCGQSDLAKQLHLFEFIFFRVNHFNRQKLCCVILLTKLKENF